MNVDSIKTNDDSIIIVVIHNNSAFGVVTKLIPEGDAVLNSINDYYEHSSNESDVCIVSFKVNIGIKRRVGLFRTKLEHFKTECHKVVVDSKRVQTWVDGIKTRDIEHGAFN